MCKNLVAYIATAIVFFGMDFIWLNLAQSSVYRPRIGALLLEKPNLAAAGAFYLLYVLGVLIFAVMPAIEHASWLRALAGGAFLGLIAYGTYDMTNMATLTGWSAFVSAVDMAWGVFATGVAATAGYLVTRLV